MIAHEAIFSVTRWNGFPSVGDTSRVAHTQKLQKYLLLVYHNTGIVHTKTVENTKTAEFQQFSTSYWNRPHKKTAENSQNKKKTHLHTLFTKNVNVTKM